MTGARRNVFEGKVITVNIETARLPNGKTATLEVVHHPGGAAAVAIDREGRVCLVRQYRHVAGGWLWELPAGRLEPGESPQSTAARELEEEAGVRAGRWDSLGRVLSSPGVFDEVIHLYLARDVARVAASTEEHEVIEVHWLPLAEACARAYAGEILDAKTVVGLVRADSWLRARSA